MGFNLEAKCFLYHKSILELTSLFGQDVWLIIIMLQDVALKCCVRVARPVTQKGLSDRDRPGAVDRKYLSLQIQVTSGQKETTVY